MPDSLSVPINRRVSWRLVAFGIPILLISAVIVLGGVTTAPPFDSLMVNRVIFSLVSVVSLYIATIGLARLSYARRGLSGISIDIINFNSGVSRIRYRTLSVSEIAGLSTTNDHIIVRTEAGRRIQIPIKALDTDLSANELLDSIRSVLPDTGR